MKWYRHANQDQWTGHQPEIQTLLEQISTKKQEQQNQLEAVADEYEQLLDKGASNWSPEELERFKEIFKIQNQATSNPPEAFELEEMTRGKYFVRFGQWPEEGRSRFGLGEEWSQELGGKKFEQGVSVYHASPIPQGWLIDEPREERALYGLKDYFRHMFGHFGPLKQPAENEEIFLVQGDLIEEPEVIRYPDGTVEETGGTTYATGSDGEPLLSNLKQSEKLPLSAVFIGSEENPIPVSSLLPKELEARRKRHVKIAKAKYIGQCDRLRQAGDEDSWQKMMASMEPISIEEFMDSTNFEDILDEEEEMTPEQQLRDWMADDPEAACYRSYWKNKPAFFLQKAGFEFVFV
jgi:hypothetical protein